MTTLHMHKFDPWQLLAFIVAVILLSIFLSSCVTRSACERKFPPQIGTKDSIVRSVQWLRKDSLIKIPMDSGYYYALIECQKTAQGKWEPVIQDQKTTGKIHLAGKFTVDTFRLIAKIDSQAVYLHWKELHETIKETISESKTYPVNVLTWLQKILIPCGWVFIGLILGVLAYFGLKLMKVL